MRMKTTYSIIDFKDIVTQWYNDFLPVAFEDNLVFLEMVDLVYLNALPLETKSKESLEFLVEKSKEMVSSSGADIGIVVQEPKPVNNVRVQKFLKFLDGFDKFSDSTREKILHIANKRYVVSSSNVLVSDDKTIGNFLDAMFVDIRKLVCPSLRFYASQSLGTRDVEDAAVRLFPKNLLIKPQGNLVGKHIQVSSSSEVLMKISNQIMNDSTTDSRMQKFIGRCQKMVMKDFEQII